MKVSREERLATAARNAARSARAAAERRAKGPVEFDWDRAREGLRAILASVYGEEVVDAAE